MVFAQDHWNRIESPIIDPYVETCYTDRGIKNHWEIMDC